MRTIHFLSVVSLTFMSLTFGAGLQSARGAEGMGLTYEPREELSDSTILGVAQITNRIQIQGSQIALKGADFFEVVNFANSMISDYQNYDNILNDFMRRNSIVPRESEFGRQVEEEGFRAIEDLRQLHGRDLEMAYIDYEIVLHTRTLETIDYQFLPNVTNIELRNLITSLRGVVQSRLDWAKRIQVTMS